MQIGKGVFKVLSLNSCQKIALCQRGRCWQLAHSQLTENLSAFLHFRDQEAKYSLFKSLFQPLYRIGQDIEVWPVECGGTSRLYFLSKRQNLLKTRLFPLTFTFLLLPLCNVNTMIGSVALILRLENVERCILRMEEKEDRRSIVH